MSKLSTDEQFPADYLHYLNSRPNPIPSRTVSSIHGFDSGFDAEEQFVYGEKRGDFFLLQREYFERFQPASPEERFQVDNLIRAEWSLRRLFRAETHLWEYHSILSDGSSGVSLGEGFNRASDVFMRMQRRIAGSEQAYEKAYKELGRLQGMRTSASKPATRFADAQARPEPRPPAPPPPPLEPEPQPAAPQPVVETPPSEPLLAQPPQPEAQPAQANAVAAPVPPTAPYKAASASAAAASTSAAADSQPGPALLSIPLPPPGGGLTSRQAFL
jgi:hypothetical protein